MKHVQDDRIPTDEPNLRNAFAPIPPDVREQLVRTARSVKEEEKAKNRPYRLRPALVAAIVVFATMSVALAVGGSVGWNEFFSQFHGSSVPAPIQERMDDVAHTSLELGPVTFTVEQALCDGQLVMVSVSARMTDGSAALLAPDEDWNSPVSVTADTEQRRLGLAEDVTWLDAARQQNQPIYAVQVLTDFGQLGGDQYMGYLYDAEGGYVAVSGFSVEAGEIGDAVPVDFLLGVSAIDPETGNTTQEWQDDLAYTVRVNRDILGEKTYMPEEALEVGGCRLESVRMELRVTGAYVYTTFTASDAVNRESGEALDACYQIEVVDQDGNAFSEGASLSSYCDDSAWPVLVRSDTVMIDTLPDAIGIRLSYDDETVHLLK